VTIVEFSDFECPYCGGLFPTLQRVEDNYKDKIRIVYRQLPLNNLHPPRAEGGRGFAVRERPE
jgi:protein-disulfide isomerase